MMTVSAQWQFSNVVAYLSARARPCDGNVRGYSIMADKFLNKRNEVSSSNSIIHLQAINLHTTSINATKYQWISRNLRNATNYHDARTKRWDISRCTLRRRRRRRLALSTERAQRKILRVETETMNSYATTRPILLFSGRRIHRWRSALFLSFFFFQIFHESTGRPSSGALCRGLVRLSTVPCPRGRIAWWVEHGRDIFGHPSSSS